MFCFSILIHVTLALLNLIFLLIDIIFIPKITTSIIYSIAILMILFILIFFCYHMVTWIYLAHKPKLEVTTVLRINIIPIFALSVSLGISSLIIATNMNIMGNSQYFTTIGSYLIVQAIISVPEIILFLVYEFQKYEKNSVAPKKTNSSKKDKKMLPQMIFYKDNN